MGRHVKNLSGLKFNKLTVLTEIKRELWGICNGRKD